MKICITTHQAAGFGEIPEGSLWDDDSPYLTDAGNFGDYEPPVDGAEDAPETAPADDVAPIETEAPAEPAESPAPEEEQA